MENNEYNRLIYTNKLNELSEIWNISDFTRYKYLNKYLLEYLLEKNIHTTRMDNYAHSNGVWIDLYIKYKIIEPLVNSELSELLKDESLLDKLLKVLNDKQKIELYQNFKKQDYWLLLSSESLIIEKYLKYGIKLPRLFLRIPLISDKKNNVSKNMQLLLDEFSKTYNNLDNKTKYTLLNELKRNIKVNKARAINDIIKLIEYKKTYPGFKFKTFELFDEEEAQGGKYNSESETITIDQYRNGIFSHEFSHLLFNEFEYNQEIVDEYKIIQKEINKPKTVKKIISYLNNFHHNYEYMYSIFLELYIAQIKNEYGSFSNFLLQLCNDMVKTDPLYITIDQNNTQIYLTGDNLKEIIFELLKAKWSEYANILTDNYYTEELFLENLLDALLKGNIYEGKYKIDCLSGHTKKYYKESKESSFDEVLANYYAIINSKKANKLISDLRELVGDDLIELLDEYMEVYRNNKIYQKKKKNN